MRHTALCLVALLTLVSCGSSTEPRENPVPVLDSVDPSTVTIGSSSATLSLSGKGFVRESQVQWDGSDRTTTYASETSLRAALTGEDLSHPGHGTITVVNPPPGGGISKDLRVTVGYPVPVLNSVSPTAVDAGGPEFTLTLRGSEFLGSGVQSVAYLDRQSLVTTFVSQTELKAHVPASEIEWGRFGQVTVRTPAPGGGRSDSLPISIRSPVPTAIALLPDSASTGYTFDLSVVGRDFDKRGIIEWNGVAQTTTFQNSAALSARIPGSDVTGPGTAQVTVLNPPPGGGRSDVLSIVVRDAPPMISALEPGKVTAGSGDVGLIIRGNGFTSASVVEWDGQARASTYIDSQRLDVEVSAADLANPGTVHVVVVNPGTGMRSREAFLPILPAALEATSVLKILLKNRYIASDPVRTLVYASIPSNAPVHADEVVALNPWDGTVVWSVPIGGQPDRMTLAHDCSYLYVTIVGTSTVARVNLATRTKDLDIQLPRPTVAIDIAVIPNHPTTIVVSLRQKSEFAGLAVFDGGTMRPHTTGLDSRAHEIESTNSEMVIFGFDTETSESALRRFFVASDGIHENFSYGKLLGGSNQFVYDSDYLYTSNGAVVDVARMEKIGSTGMAADVRPDVANGRVHYVHVRELVTFHATTLGHLGTIDIRELKGSRYPVRWGVDGIATGGKNSVVFIRSPLIGS